MVDPDVLEPIAARRVELDELEDQQAKQLDQVRAERDELAVAERVLARMAEQLAVRMSRPCCRRRRSRVASRGAAGPPGPGVAEDALPAGVPAHTRPVPKVGGGAIASVVHASPPQLPRLRTPPAHPQAHLAWSAITLMPVD
ncbi:hypothetical protein ACFVH7_35685 [Kitasatospora indigofera]|uniref:hypothetical protein n=1 Tax=Kitasatospora indigofera TaxID=67307 RepID=UPI00363A56C8